MRVESRAARRRGGVPIALSQIRRLSVNRGITAVRIADNYFWSASRPAKNFFLSGSGNSPHPALVAEQEGVLTASIALFVKIFLSQSARNSDTEFTEPNRV